MGRLATAQKRPQIMLEISSQIKNRVIIIGDGEARSEINDRIRENSLNVELLGYKQNPWQYLNQNDLLIIPSFFEGDGLVVIEAISRNLPILLSDIPDFRRFGFPDSNYCATTDDFVQRINKYESKVSDLKISDEIRNLILKTRTSEEVGNTWITYLSN